MRKPLSAVLGPGTLARTAPRAVCLLAAIFAFGPASQAQTFRRLGTEFAAMRSVVIGSGKKPAIVVVQFFHHGQLRDDGRNLAVVTKSGGRPAPSRVLQVGPGDYCRVAFQALEGQTAYEIFYGGEPPQEEPPPWTSNAGLLLETREFKSCNLQNAASVREAFEGSRRIGSDYVDGIHHGHNPFALRPGPFLSRYRGYLHLAAGGTYGFITSSQDASFVWIDGKLVTEQPGVHPPRHQARPGFRQDVALSAGTHELEYYHAAVGPTAVMTLSWEVNPRDPTPHPSPIPPEVFAAEAIGREAPSPPVTRAERSLPDFLVNLAGSVPLPDNDRPLIGVQFLDASPKALTAGAKLHWEFGDGQASEQPNPDHVYLRPGLYRVRLAVRRGARTVEIANRIEVDEPKFIEPGKWHQLDDYLRVLETYNPRTLDAASLRQLVAAFQTKAERLLAGEEPGKPLSGSSDAPPRARGQADPGRKAQAMRFWTLAVEAGKTAFSGESAAEGDEDLIRLARAVALLARDNLGNAQTAATIWRGAAAKIRDGALRAECLVEAADVAINDLVDPQAARPLLDEAARLRGADRVGLHASRFWRVWGDYYAATGKGDAARRAYLDAEAATDARGTHAERIAWQGARSRSTEQFLKSGEYERAMLEIRQWQDAFPSDKIVGLLTLMYARYWAGRQQYAQAIAAAEQLAAVNADSPYLDQAQMLAAECHRAAGSTDKAIATLESLLKSQPGSPLVPEARRRLAEWKSADAPAKNTKNP